jgi:hypothetical protein
LDFGNVDVGRVRFQGVTCTNNGEENATVVSLAIYDDSGNVFSVADHSEIQVGEVIPGKSERTLWVQFVPSGRAVYDGEVNILMDYTSEPFVIDLSGRGIAEGSDGRPLLQYYRYSDVPSEFTGYAGQSELFVVELTGDGLAVDRVIEPGSPYIFSKVYEQTPLSSSDFPVYSAERNGHYIYSVYLRQDRFSELANSQLIVMDTRFNTLLDSVMMGSFISPAGWLLREIPTISVTLDKNDSSDASKAVYLAYDEVTANIKLNMHIDLDWSEMPDSVINGDFYLLMMNNDGTKLYCYDIDANDFHVCGVAYPAASDVSPVVNIDDAVLPFHMPVNSRGLWHIYVGVVTSDGNVFFDQAAVIAGQTTGGEVVELY